MRLRPNTVAAVLSVGALMIGALMLFATADLIGNMNPDPYDREADFTVSGTFEGSDVSGTAHYKTINEGGAYHNYLFDVEVEGAPSYSFLVPFGPDDVPSGYTYVGKDVIKHMLDVYSILLDGITITIEVGDMCSIEVFGISGGGYDITGVLA